VLEHLKREMARSAKAVGANIASFTQPSDADACPDAETFTLWAELLDDADDLVTGDDSRVLRLEVALADVQIRSANATRLHPHEDLAVTGNRHLHVGRSQGVPFDRRGMFEEHRVHARHTPPGGFIRPSTVS
jgi:hypothetical protein